MRHIGKAVHHGARHGVVIRVGMRRAGDDPALAQPPPQRHRAVQLRRDAHHPERGAVLDERGQIGPRGNEQRVGRLRAALRRGKARALLMHAQYGVGVLFGHGFGYGLPRADHGRQGHAQRRGQDRCGAAQRVGMRHGADGLARALHDAASAAAVDMQIDIARHEQPPARVDHARVLIRLDVLGDFLDATAAHQHRRIPERKRREYARVDEQIIHGEHPPNIP